MTHQTRGNRLALLISLAALVVSLGTTAGPVMAKALVDADTVDGLHAVRAGASDSARAGRLVATKAGNGRLPNDIIARAPDAKLLDGAPASAYQGTYLPPTTVTHNPYPASVSSAEGTYHTARAGYLYVQAATSFTVTCPDNGVVEAWLDVDGTNVDSSRQNLLHASADTAIDVTLSGITGASLSAGDHTVSVHFGCSGGQYSTYLGLGGPGYAVVLPSSYRP
jgi:hypothetical protein